MAGRKKDDKIIFSEQIVQKSMEEVMHDSMMPYSEYVILERALPRVEDGLKPVQRRILYTMHELGNTFDKPHRKCARIVGDCLGKFHPHGDTSVYDALARMAQPFVMRAPLVDGHGNFGSIDGDSPAAMRYTEARMTELAQVLLQDIDKDTVGFHLNFDDTQKEPDVLPGRFPNLLVNGANGIAVGLATNIPPHNLGEAIAATVAQIEDPDITTEELMRYIPAPDFPTGGVLARDGELFEAYQTGRGKLKLRAKVEIEPAANGKTLLVIREIPYQVNKSAMLEKILRLSEEKKSLLSGINDIRDESDRQGMRAVIELKRDVDPHKVLNVLYKYSDLQVTVGVNMVAIADGKPVQLGLKALIGHYIRHQKDVVTRRTRHELEQAEARAHILEGLIVAVDNLDEVIRLIRGSKTPREARDKLMQRFSLTELQAQAILDMRLQRLTNLEILTLRKEYAELEKRIASLKAILASEKKLMNVIKKELEEIGEKYADARRTQLVDSEIATSSSRKKPPWRTRPPWSSPRAGFVRRFARRAAEKALEGAEPPRAQLDVMTDEKLLFFTNAGNCYAVGVSQIPECRPPRPRSAAGRPAGGSGGGRALHLRLRPRQGLGGRDDAAHRRRPHQAHGRFRPQRAQGALRGADAARGRQAGRRAAADDLQRRARRHPGRAWAICFSLAEVSVLGRTAAGVKAIQLAPADRATACIAHDGEGEALLVTDRGYMKRCLLLDFDRQARGGKGLKAITFLKNGMNGEAIAAALPVREARPFTVFQKSGAQAAFNTEEIAIETRAGKGQPYVLAVMGDCVEDVLMG